MLLRRVVAAIEHDIADATSKGDVKRWNIGIDCRRSIVHAHESANEDTNWAQADGVGYFVNRAGILTMKLGHPRYGDSHTNMIGGKLNG